MQSKEEEQQAASADAVFPVILQIMENCIFNAKDPIVLGCTIEEGIAKVGLDSTSFLLDTSKCCLDSFPQRRFRSAWVY